TIDSKLIELNEADKIRDALKVVGEKPAVNSPTYAIELRQKVDLARKALKDYQEKLEVSGPRELDQGYQETEQVKALEQLFQKLDDALTKALVPRIDNGADRPDEATRNAIDDLVRAAD